MISALENSPKINVAIKFINAGFRSPKKGERLFPFWDCGSWIRRATPRQVKKAKKAKLYRLFSFLFFDTLTEFEVRKESYGTRFFP